MSKDKKTIPQGKNRKGAVNKPRRPKVNASAFALDLSDPGTLRAIQAAALRREKGSNKRNAVEYLKEMNNMEAQYAFLIVEKVWDEDIQPEKVSTWEKVERYLKGKYIFRYDEVGNRVEYALKEERVFRELNNLEDTIYRELNLKHFKFSFSNVCSLLRGDFVPRYNPFDNYFKSLPAHNGEDIIEKLASFVSTTQQEFFRIQFKKMLVRVVACALEDKVVNKQCFVLVGSQQNTGKSYFWRWLTPDILIKYYTENINTDKDSVIALSTNIFINLDELATFSRLEINSFKAFLSKQFVNVRHPYGKKTELTPRRASFVGSTNKSDFLTDETGSVRWLCFELIGEKPIDWNYSSDIDKTQLWAQAYALYNAGFEYGLTEDERRSSEANNDQYYQPTPELELLQEYFHPGTSAHNDYSMTATQLVTTFNNGLIEGSGDGARTVVRACSGVRISSTGMGKALRKLGYKPLRDKSRGNAYCYYLNAGPLLVQQKHIEESPQLNAFTDQPKDEFPTK